MNQVANRRSFLKSTSAVGGSFLITGTRASGQVNGASERVRVAVAGLNGRGQSHLSGWLGQSNVEVAYVVDPDDRVRARAMSGLEKRSEGKFATKDETDIRKVLEDPTVDAISIATPNHWHSLMTIWAAQAGKHVYVEKPMSCLLYTSPSPRD